MSTHITKLSFTISAAFGVSVNISLGSRCTKTLVHAFFTAGSDYCDSLLWWTSQLPYKQVTKNTECCRWARLMCQQRRYCHITPLLFKILLITFKALKGLACTYLYIDSLISIKSTSRYDLRSSNDSLLLKYPKTLSKVKLGDRSFTYWLPQNFGTLFLWPSDLWSQRCYWFWGQTQNLVVIIIIIIYNPYIVIFENLRCYTIIRCTKEKIF